MDHKLSEYALKLDSAVKKRYMEKISIIGGMDPFLIPAVACSEDILPPIGATDLVGYFVFSTSFCTAAEFKAYKSLEAYNQFVSGWVNSVKGYKADKHGCMNPLSQDSRYC